MTTEPLPPNAELSRKLASDLYNAVWTLLEKPDRTPDETEQMIHAAHASRYFWGQIGTPVNFTRGDWQISRAYAVAGRAEPALYHAQRALEHCTAAGIGDFDLAYAYEALARATTLAGQAAESARYVQLAREAGERIAQQEDRDLFFGDLATLPGPT
jgi:hypothetical protein